MYSFLYVMRMFTCCAFVFLTFASSALPFKEALFLGDIDNTLPFDKSIMAISHDPTLIYKIDQKQNFIDTKRYEKARDKSIHELDKILPINKKNDGVVEVACSVCVLDMRVYFWYEIKGYDVLGYVPLQKLGPYTSKDSAIVLWVVPRSSAESSSVDNQISADEIATLFRKIFEVNAEVVFSESNQCIVKIDKNKDNGDVNVLYDGNVMQVRMVSPSSAKIKSSKPSPSNIFNDKPLVLPFWPPQDD